MKWIFIAALLLFVPIVAAVLRSRTAYLGHACFVLGALPFFLNLHLYVAPISWASWSGIIKGIEVTVVDALALAILLSTRPRLSTPLPIKIFFAVYVAGLVVSTFAGAGQLMEPSVFYAWQLLRAVLVYLAVSRATATYPRAAFALIAGMGVSVLFECVMATWQYVHGSVQAGGTLGHRTNIGMMSQSVVMPAFALLFGGFRRAFPVLIVTAGAVIAYVGAGRATIALYGIGMLITLMLSLRHKVTTRKLVIGAAAIALLAVCAPVADLAISRRSTADIESSNQERRALIDAAEMMIAEHPLGVGANNYVLIDNIGGYAERAGVSWFQKSRSEPVHNSYLLVLAELGWIGLIGLVGLLVSVMALGWSSLRWLPSGESSDLIVGVLGAIIITSIHSAYEFVPMMFSMHYMFAMDFGLLTGLTSVALRVRRERAAKSLGHVPDVERTPAMA